MSNLDDRKLEGRGGSMRDFRYLPGTNILDRVSAFLDWHELRLETGLWPLGRSTETGPRSKCFARTAEGELFDCITFASQDSLSLSSPPDIHAVEIEQITENGITTCRERGCTFVKIPV